MPRSARTSPWSWRSAALPAPRRREVGLRVRRSPPQLRSLPARPSRRSLEAGAVLPTSASGGGHPPERQWLGRTSEAVAGCPTPGRLCPRSPSGGPPAVRHDFAAVAGAGSGQATPPARSQRTLGGPLAPPGRVAAVRGNPIRRGDQAVHSAVPQRVMPGEATGRRQALPRRPSFRGHRGRAQSPDPRSAAVQHRPGATDACGPGRRLTSCRRSVVVSTD
jgi:hypothetical protein